MSVADLAHLLKVSFDWGYAAGRRPAHRLGNECDDRLGAELCDLRLELPGEAFPVVTGRLVGPPTEDTVKIRTGYSSIINFK